MQIVAGVDYRTADIGKSCMRFKGLEDVDLATLKDLIKRCRFP